MWHHPLYNKVSDGPKERWRDLLFGRGVTDSASRGRQRHPTPAWSEGARLLLGGVLYSPQLLTSGLPVRPIWWEVEQQDTPPLPRSLLGRRLGRCHGFAASSPTPNPVAEAASHCQDGYNRSWGS